MQAVSDPVGRLSVVDVALKDHRWSPAEPVQLTVHDAVLVDEAGGAASTTRAGPDNSTGRTTIVDAISATIAPTATCRSPRLRTCRPFPRPLRAMVKMQRHQRNRGFHVRRR